MTDLTAEFERRLADGQNDVYLANLSHVVGAHRAFPLDPEGRKYEDTEDNPFFSANGDGVSVIVDRRVETVVGAHGLTDEALKAFVNNAAVLDVGAGRSPFLDIFKKEATTLCVDPWEEYASFQSGSGHLSLRATGVSLPVQSESIRLLNASWSLPFWSIDPKEARSAAREYARVLEIGGIAMVGPLTRSDFHADWELAACSGSSGSAKSRRPWRDGDNAFMSATLISFVDELISLRIQGSLDGGYIDVSGTRHNSAGLGNIRGMFDERPEHHVPNYLMFRKVA